jgi:hypothetical protein
MSQSSPGGSSDHPRTGRADIAGYLLAAVVLIVGGGLLSKPTPILNWLVGPGIAVICVAVTVRIGRRRSRGQGRPDDESGAAE